MQNNYLDFHCHPAIKPFGKSFNRKPTGENSANRNRVRSIWRYNPPTLMDKLLNYLIGVTKFSQANFSSLSYGGVSVVCVSLSPIEKYFFRNKMTNEFILDIAANFATGVGKKRVDHIQGIKDYFKDLEKELKYYQELDGTIIRLPEGKFRYKLVNSFKEIEAIRLVEEELDSAIQTICVVLSIEGMHVLLSNVDKTPTEEELLKNLMKIKAWKNPPFFVGIAHHFWNHLCGHAESLTGIIKKHTDQGEGLNMGITQLGKSIIKNLLDTRNGKRILIDIKHMSPASRNEYYHMLDTNPEYKDIPIIVSHGATNGLISSTNRTQGRPRTASKLNPVDINFFDEEIIRIAKTKGIFGLQLDERRVASKKTLRNIKKSVHRNKIMHYRSELIWNQVQHIAELLDAEGIFAWDCLVIGSDFDGIVNPLNGFWTSEELPYLADFLERHAFNYVQNNPFRLAENNLNADEIIARIMGLNGNRFLKDNFK
ncbi:membrane dipeptidase [Arenibacter latericius]|uniref:membrane dipeptidase n=1 Tax=Arenibacter latericius TaxID=86104 RepID=UPI000428FDAA|nr:membrane dipeptidase [Arenibacter latericius]